jgi:hypothetical protein
MIRGPQIQELHEAGLHYITAISKPQIETLLRRSVLQMDLFDDKIAEIIPQAAGEEESRDSATPHRYILRRNPVRAREIATTRKEKLERLNSRVAEANDYLSGGPRRRVSVQVKSVTAHAKRLGISAWVSVIGDGTRRSIGIEIDKEALTEESQLDGCYVIVTDLTAEELSKEEVHQRYKDLNAVENVFRRSKTVELEVRPVHVRKAASTEGHMLVVMLAYRLTQELGKRWAKLDLKVSEGLDRLNTYCAVETVTGEHLLITPREDVQSLLEAAEVKLPRKLPGRGARKGVVRTKKQLTKNRPKRVK